MTSLSSSLLAVRRTARCGWLWLAALAWPCTALAAPTEAELARARQLATEGIALEESGHCDQAIAKFSEAHRLYPEATTITHRLAQCHVTTGQLAEAWRAYSALAATPLAADASEPFRKAKSVGATEAARLEPRVPKVHITLQPSPPPSGWVVHLVALDDDGKARVTTRLDPSWLGKERPTNPGRYQLHASAPGKSSAPTELLLLEGSRKQVILSLRSEAAGAATAAPAIDGGEASRPDEPEPPAPYIDVPSLRREEPAKTALLLQAGFGVGAVSGPRNGDASLYATDDDRLPLVLQGAIGVRHGLGQYTLHVDAIERGGDNWVVPVTANIGFRSTARSKVAFFLHGGPGIAFGDGAGPAAKLSLGVSFPLGKLLRLPLGPQVLVASPFGGSTRAVAAATLNVGLQFDIGLRR